jgi:hypothetical protein
MLGLYRKYKATIDWIDQKKFSMETRTTVFNLANVDEWESVDNDYEGFNDKFERTKVVYKNMQYNIIRCPYKEFDATMDQFLNEAHALDERSMFGVKKKELPLKETYNGPIEYLFTPFKNVIISYAYPKGNRPTSADDAMGKVIWENFIKYN